MAVERHFVQWAPNPLKVTDTTLRDGHQSSLATRMRLQDMEPIAEEMDRAGFYSIEVWGGATFDVATRFLNEDPWERVRILKRLMPNTPFQMLLRGQNLVGYRNYPDDVVRAFVHQAAEVGIDIFRVFDAVNDERNFEAAFAAIKECGKHIQGVVCYSLTERQMGGPVYNLDYYLRKACLLQDMGAHSVCIKDMAGLIAPYDAYELVRSLKQALHVPVQLHTHYTSGMASMSCLKAIEAGVDIIDTALAPFALRTSQPAVEPIVVALQGTPRDTGLDLDALFKLGQYLESIAPKYRDFLDTTKMAVIDTGVLIHQIPGGMLSNLVAQLREADALDRLQEVYEELPRTRKEMGYPPLVTPTSQIVGVQAVQNVLFGRYKMISAEVKDYFYGLYGKPPAPVDPETSALALKGYERGQQPIIVRAGEVLEPEMPKAKEATQGIAKDSGDELIYALYPTTGLRFLRWKYGLEPPPPEVQPKSLEDVKREDGLIAKAKSGLLSEKAPTETLAKGPGARSFNIYIGDEHYKVEVEAADGAAPRATISSPSTRPVVSSTPLQSRPAPPPRATEQPEPRKGAEVPAAPGPTAPRAAAGEVAIVAPIPGMVIRYEVEVGAKVKAGETVVILEAMKMQNALPSPVEGMVKALGVAPGARVAKNDVLAVIAQA